MKKVLATVFLILTLMSCGTDDKPKIIHSDKNENDLTEFKNDSSYIEIADLPIQIDSTDYLIHPIGYFKIDKEKGKSIYKSSSYGTQSFSVSSYSGYRITGNISNLMFQHVDSDKLTPLTSAIIKIRSLTFLKNLSVTTDRHLLVYEINDKDTNQDGQLDYKDINTLYLSRIDGTEFMKISEPNRELIDWKIIERQNRLYFRTIEDGNKDGKFNRKDIVHYKYINLTDKKLEIVEYKPI